MSCVFRLFGIFSVLAIAFLAQSTAFAQDRAVLAQAMRNVIPALPMYGRSKEAQSGHVYDDNGALKSSFYGEGDAGMLGLPIAEPSVASYKISWSVEPTAIRATPEERQAAYIAWGDPCLGKNVNPGTLGLDTCVGSNAQAGAQDVNWSADPYMASGTAAAVRVCATVWVQATVSASPHASHGARTRPEVMQAMEVIARNFAQSAATEIMRAVDGACAGATQPLPPDDGTGVPPDTLTASLDCPATITISALPSLNCHILINSWIRNTDDPVQVIFPDAVDTFGNQANGLQVPQGAGTEYVYNWGQAPKSWGFFLFACPALQNTGANCYNSVTAPGPVVLRIIVRQRDQQVAFAHPLTAVPHPNVQAASQAYLNQVFVNGYYFATADIGLQLRWDRTVIAGAINGMRQSAASSGVLPVDGIDQLVGLINAGVQDAQLAPQLAALKAQFAQITNRQCQNNLNLYWIWVLGYYTSSAEMGAQYGLDKGWLISQLNELRNAAAATALPVASIDQALGYLNAGYTQQQTYQSVVAIKNELVQGTNYIYACN
jgi:hypothetical protein